MPVELVRADLLEDRGLRGRAFVERYTQRIDEWLVGLFEEALGGVGGVALVATGGHGRRELAPQSDLDLLLLHSGTLDLERSERLWYPMWDARLKVGHSTRTVRETLSLAADDLATATALLSARHLVGDDRLTEHLAEAAGAQWRRQHRMMLAQLCEAVAQRHAAGGDAAAALEPELKEGRGGLRDVHALRWMRAARLDLDVTDPDELAYPYDVLLQARVELHRITGRPGDTLRLQDQVEVAERLDYFSADELMTDLVTAARQIAWASDDAWSVLAASERPPLLRRGAKPLELDGGIVVETRRVRIDPSGIDDHSVLRCAVAAASHQARIEPATLRVLGDAPALPAPWPDDARALFIELLATGHAAIPVIESLDLAELWVPLIPEWAPNRSRPQANAYHRFTVDRHSLEAAATAAGLVDRVDRRDLLLMAALLHDIGKGYPGEHSVTGVELTRSIMTRMGFEPEDVETVQVLVEHHLLLPDTATRRDIDDPATAALVVAKVGTPERLGLLAALAEADSLATGPSAWSPWKAGLMAQLTDKAVALATGRSPSRASTARERASARRELVAKARTIEGPSVVAEGDRLSVVCRDRPAMFSRIAGVLALNGLDVLEANASTEGDVAVEEFRVVSAFGKEIAWSKVTKDIERALTGRLALEPRLAERARSYRRRRIGRGLDPAVRVLHDQSSDESTVVEIVGEDRVGLLFRLTRTLADLDLDILQAKVATMGDDVVDAFYVRPRDRSVLTEDDSAEIRSALLYTLSQPEL
ncbi:MAG: [protein-PII] uridylyltransferase [Microthrixaceae bacterium]